jgi:drug/metabolite transporter (DMT)-like permease
MFFSGFKLQIKAYIILFFVIVVYSGNILVGKAINELLPVTIAFCRFFIAFIILTPLGALQAYNNRHVYLKHKMALLVMTLSGVTLFSIFIYSALRFTSSSNVAILETVIPALTVILSVCFLKEYISKIQWLGVIISIFGAVWVVSEGKPGILFNSLPNIGDLLMVGAIFSWAVYSVFVKRYIHHFKLFGVVWFMTGTSVLLLLPALVIEWSVFGIPDIFGANKFIGLLYLGVFPSVIALLLYSRAVSVLGAGKASVMLNLLPVFTMVGAYFLLGEAVSFAQIIGSVIVIFGVSMTVKLKN